MTTTSSALKPSSFASIAWSAPLGTEMLPGVTEILYGAAASTLRDTISTADSA